MGFEVGDKVVYTPHGAGIVVAKETRGDDFGTYLSIRIAHSNMTLMVPADAAESKGVRPVMNAKTAGKLLKELSGDGSELPENPQERGRYAVQINREGAAEQMVKLLRDFAARVRDGKKMSIGENKSIESAKLMLSSEIALATDIEISAAAEQIDAALGIEN